MVGSGSDQDQRAVAFFANDQIDVTRVGSAVRATGPSAPVRSSPGQRTIWQHHAQFCGEFTDKFDTHTLMRSWMEERAPRQIPEARSTSSGSRSGDIGGFSSLQPLRAQAHFGMALYVGQYQSKSLLILLVQFRFTPHRPGSAGSRDSLMPSGPTSMQTLLRSEQCYLNG